jgi:hypothetical protein
MLNEGTRLPKFKQMKNKILLFLFVFQCFSASCQKNVLKSNAIVIIPQNAQKLSSTQLSDYVKTNFKDYKPPIPLNSEHAYKINNVFLSYWDVNESSEQFKKPLKAVQSEALEGMSWNKAYVVNSSKIITVNNIQFLIINYQRGNDAFIKFDSEYKNLTCLNGIIQFTKGNETEANQVLNDFLKTVNIDMY